MEKQELYMPSNGSEGEIFLEKWCGNCKKDSTFRKEDAKTMCPIFTKSLVEDNVKQWIYKDGIPTCTSFVHYQTKKQRIVKNQMQIF